MPLLDKDLDEARDIFNLDVLFLTIMARAFLPLLWNFQATHSGVRDGVSVNITSCSSLTCVALPFAGAYNAT
jgi:1-acylglycerone phosphate reductase